MLGHDYGFKRIMSSYYFQDTDQVVEHQNNFFKVRQILICAQRNTYMCTEKYLYVAQTNTYMCTDKYLYVHRQILICAQRNTYMCTQKYFYVHRQILICAHQGPPGGAPASFPNICGNGWTCEHRLIIFRLMMVITCSLSAKFWAK